MDREQFEEYVIKRTDLIQWPEIWANIRKRVERSEIKVVDVHRKHEDLVIVFRKLVRLEGSS